MKSTRTIAGLRQATITDVATRANVSIKTVSRVVNAEPNVRPALRSLVQNVIDELDYSPNPYARHLGSLRRNDTTMPTANRQERGASRVR